MEEIDRLNNRLGDNIMFNKSAWNGVHRAFVLKIFHTVRVSVLLVKSYVCAAQELG